MKLFCGTLAFLLLLAVFCTIPAEGQSVEGEYVVVANRDLQGSSISTAILKGIYLREIRSWANGPEIVPVDLSTANGFYQNLFGRSYVQMQAYWLNMKIKNGAALPVVKNDADSVKQFIAENKGAIGFLRNNDLDDRVKVLKVTH
jgi:ABC-type phosphate transport system substrate-binding protein